MSILALYLIIVGVFTVVFGGVWFVVVAFRRHFGWGFAVLFIPLANVIFLLRSWSRAKRPFLLFLGGIALCALGLSLSPPKRRADLVAFCTQLGLLPKSHAAPGSGEEDATKTKLAELRIREQGLLARKAALKPGDIVGAQELARDIKVYNAELKAALAHTSPAAARSEIDPVWTTNIGRVQIPLTPAAGRMAGRTFSIDHAWIENGTLTLRHGRGLVPDHELLIVLADQSPAGKTFKITPQSSSDAPHVQMKRVGGSRRSAETKSFADGYAMRLEFGDISAGQMSGGIYLCLPDAEKSYLAGTFWARVVDNTPAPKPGTAAPATTTAETAGGGTTGATAATTGTANKSAATVTAAAAKPATPATAAAR